MHLLHNQGISTFSAVILLSALQWKYL